MDDSSGSSFCKILEKTFQVFGSFSLEDDVNKKLIIAKVIRHGKLIAVAYSLRTY